MTDPDRPAAPNAAAALAHERAAAVVRALRKHRQRLERKLEAIRGDLADAERGPEARRAGEALLTYLHQVPKRAARVTLPDPADPARTLELELDATLTPQANAARYFKRAAKAERALEEVPVRLRATEAEIARAGEQAERVQAALSRAAAPDADAAAARKLERTVEDALATLPPVLRREVPEARVNAPQPEAAPGAAPVHVPAPARRKVDTVPQRLQPRRLRTTEGWDVLIGRSNEGNDHVTHVLARPEDYWFHVHGASGSHVVLRRGKSKNEPSKKTLEEVAAWAAFYSQARTAGKVPVIWTLKKYVRRPRKAPPGLVVCEREKTLMVRPAEPPREALADTADGAAE